MTLPTGETATVRSIKKPPKKAAKVEEGATTTVGTAAELFITAGVPLLVLFKKGDEQVVPEGMLEKVYLNGPLRLNRKAVMALQPSSASGYANVYVGESVRGAWLFCGERDISDFPRMRLGPPFYWSSVHWRLQLPPGSYWFSENYHEDPRYRFYKGAAPRPVRIEVVAGREYAVGIRKKELVARELSGKAHKSLYKPDVYPSLLLDKDLTKLKPDEYRSLTAEPAAGKSESGTQPE